MLSIMMNENPCELIETKTAEEFMEALNPLNVEGHLRGNIIYRGQRDSRWDLIPSLFRRDDHVPSQKEDREINSDWTSADVNTCELDILTVFIDKIGKVNLTDYRFACILENVYKMHEERSHIIGQMQSSISNRSLTTDKIRTLYNSCSCLKKWPDIDALEIMALAQHSGLPTRLLDWTYNPYVAAHFAAFSLIGQKSDNDQKIAVWSLNKTSIPSIRYESIQNPRQDTCIYRLEPPFWGSNANAISQSGCFLFIKNLDLMEKFNGMNISEYLMKYQPFNGQTLAFKKVTLPARQFENVLEMCDLFGVSESKLFRTYEGCAADTKVRMPAIKTQINRLRADTFKCPT